MYNQAPVDSDTEEHAGIDERSETTIAEESSDSVSGTSASSKRSKSDWDEGGASKRARTNFREDVFKSIHQSGGDSDIECKLLDLIVLYWEKSAVVHMHMQTIRLLQVLLVDTLDMLFVHEGSGRAPRVSSDCLIEDLPSYVSLVHKLFYPALAPVADQWVKMLSTKMEHALRSTEGRRVFTCVTMALVLSYMATVHPIDPVQVLEVWKSNAARVSLEAQSAVATRQMTTFRLDGAPDRTNHLFTTVLHDTLTNGLTTHSDAGAGTRHENEQDQHLLLCVIHMSILPTMVHTLERIAPMLLALVSDGRKFKSSSSGGAATILRLLDKKIPRDVRSELYDVAQHDYVGTHSTRQHEHKCTRAIARAIYTVFGGGGGGGAQDHHATVVSVASSIKLLTPGPAHSQPNEAQHRPPLAHWPTLDQLALWTNTLRRKWKNALVELQVACEADERIANIFQNFSNRMNNPPEAHERDLLDRDMFGPIILSSPRTTVTLFHHALIGCARMRVSATGGVLGLGVPRFQWDCGS